MNLDELQSVQSRERQTDSLQQLRESFYRDAGEFIEQLRRERDRAAERADDPWNAPEVSRLNDDIDTAEGTVEAIYERRVGKVVKMASLAAADMPTEDEGLTAEERSLFDTLVSAIENNRAQVEAILDGADPAAVADAVGGESSADPSAAQPDRSDPTPTTDAPPSGGQEPSGGREPRGDQPVEEDTEPAERSADTAGRSHPDPDEPPLGDESGGPGTSDASRTPEPSERVDAADLMGGDGPDATGPGRDGPDEAGPGRDGPDEAGPGGDRTRDPVDETAPSPSGTDRDRSPPAGTTPTSDPEPAEPGGESAAVERQTVRITEDVGEIFGVDERQYDLTAEDVVTLPADNVEPLVKSDAAERLE